MFICHKFHLKYTCKQCNLERLKSRCKEDTNETPTCAVPVHALQANALLLGEEEGTTKARLYTLPISFFLSWVFKTQPNHWNKRMPSTRLSEDLLF